MTAFAATQNEKPMNLKSDNVSTSELIKTKWEQTFSVIRQKIDVERTRKRLEKQFKKIDYRTCGD